MGGCDARGRGRAGGQPFAAGLRSRSIREGNAHPSGSIASLPIMIRNRQHLLGEYWCVALSFALQLTLVNSGGTTNTVPTTIAPSATRTLVALRQMWSQTFARGHSMANYVM